MNRDHDGAEGLERLAKKEIEKSPHSRELIEAFLPLLLARERFVKGSPDRPYPAVLDGVRFLVGVPLIVQQRLYDRDEPWQEMAQAVVSAVKEGFPGLRDDMQRLEAAILSGRVTPCDALLPDAGEAEETVARWAAELPMAPRRIVFFLGQIKRMILQRRRRQMEAILKGATWKKGYCPICGDFPSLAVIHRKGGQRWLHCSQCGHDWPFSRVICPYCEREGQEGMTLFYVEGSERESVFACEQCKRYLITLSHDADWFESDLDLSSIGLAHLDLIMQEKGFLPMTLCDWNGFADGEEGGPQDRGGERCGAPLLPPS